MTTLFFLKAKHWQLFLLSFGLPMIVQIIWMGSMMANFTLTRDPDPLILFRYIKFFPVLMVLSSGTLFGWCWAVATGLQKKVPTEVNLNAKKFKIFFFVPIVYIAFLFVSMNLMMDSFVNQQDEPAFGFIITTVAIVIPLHFLSMFCIFYSLYFVAKTFKTVELQRKVSFSDFVAEFFLIWFYPIGIWIVQPKINAMVKTQEPNANPV
jgi:hypothetical protein